MLVVCPLRVVGGIIKETNEMKMNDSLSLTVKTNCNNFINRLLLRTFISFLTFFHGCILSTVLLKK